jgi:hypothetical protein
MTIYLAGFEIIISSKEHREEGGKMDFPCA